MKATRITKSRVILALSEDEAKEMYRLPLAIDVSLAIWAALDDCFNPSAEQVEAQERYRQGPRMASVVRGPRHPIYTDRVA